MSKFSHKVAKLSKEQKRERFDNKLEVYYKKLTRMCYIENYLPLKLLQLQKLKELRAPKRVIDASLWCIEMKRRELRRLRAWRAQHYCDFFELLVPSPKPPYIPITL
jgi:hypothetical protein